MRLSQRLFWMITCLGLAAGCGDACSDDGGSNGAATNNGTGVDVFVDSDGNACTDPTPCGNCDHDCRPSGNPFLTGEGSGGDGSGTGDGSGGTGDGSGGTGDGSGGTGDGSGGTGDGSGGDGTGGTGSGGGSGVDQSVCMDLDITLGRAIPTVVLLIDQSGSMSEGFGNGMNRLEAAYTALMDPVDGLIAELQGSFRIGMALYTSYSGGSNTCPELGDVRPELNNYEPINRVFSIAEPAGETPTGESIQGVMRMFQEHPDQGRKLLLLATDGEPDTCAVPNPQNGQPEAIAAAQAAYQQDVETVILSVGDEVGRSHLQDMANAGAGLQVGGAQNATFFEANDPTALKQQMRGIIQKAQQCIFRVSGGVVDPGLLQFATVTLDGDVLTYSDPDGWLYRQDRKTCHGAKQCIELVGEACEKLQDGMNHTVTGDFLCVYYDPETSTGGGSGGDGSGDGTGDGGDGGDGSGGTGSGSGGPGMCVSANGTCAYDGDCCSGICGGGTCVVN